ncbi:hypothetical protein [Neolewinella persica]|uniref:hypothetical protein n=1 Tax=Neolewinella persica TaxID=70998 RepID=UPI0003A62A5C|nr:hypothetical protein [Neolewinella persica]
MRALIVIMFTLALAACMRPVSPTPPMVTAQPRGTIVTVIFEIRPPSDSIHLFRVIRGEGRLRTDFPTTFTEELADGQLLFTFRSADERILKQTSLAFPGPNEYEVPSEEGTIDRVTLPEEPRSMSLRTQDVGGLKWLDISGTTDKGRIVTRRINLVVSRGD